MENVDAVIPVSNESAVKPFLELEPPFKSKRSIMFPQVYRLPLSESFLHLFNACYSATHSHETVASAQKFREKYLQQHVKLIDLRPKRWYRALRAVARDMTDIESRQKNTVKDIQALEEILSGFSVLDKYIVKNDEYKKLDAIQGDLMSQRERLVGDWQRCLAQRSAIIREISLAGYIHESLSEKGAPQPGKDLIYALRKMNQEKKPTKPMLSSEELADKSVYDDDTKWNGLAEVLRARLLVEHGKMILPAKEVRFEQGLVELSTMDKNPEIKSTLLGLHAELSRVTTEIQALEKTRDSAVEQAEADLQNQKKICQERQANLTQRIQAWNTLLAQVKSYVLEQSKRALAVMALGAFSIARGGVHETDLYNTPLGKQMRNARLQELKQPSYDAIMGDIANCQQKLGENSATAASLDSHGKDGVQKIIDKANGDIASAKSKQTLLQSKLEDYQRTALSHARVAFIAEWNNPANYNGLIDKDLVEEHVDPLEQFYNAARTLGYGSITLFHVENGIYYTESGQSPEEFMARPEASNRAAIFPYIDEQGVPSTELFQAVLGPQPARPTVSPNVPVVKFVETHELQVAWTGSALGELAKSVSFLPGQKNQTTVEKQIKVTHAANQSRQLNQEVQQHLTGSFEENLHNELTASVNLFDSQQKDKHFKRDQNNMDQSSSSNSDDRSNESSWGASAHASFFKGAFTADANASSKSSRVRKNTNAQSKEVTLALSEAEDGEALDKSTRDLAAKRLKDIIGKVSSDTSSNNKMQITLSGSEQYEETATHKETVEIVNPNMGRTVNYNTHRVQNIYTTGDTLKNVQIVIDTGMKIMEGVDITKRVVCHLEEFNKQFKLLPKSPVMTVLCAFLARRVIKNYTQLNTDPTNMGLLKLKVSCKKNEVEAEVKAINTIREIYKKLDLALSNTDPNALSTELWTKIKSLELALQELKEFTFVMNEMQMVHQTEQAVTAPAYHVETQKGLTSAIDENDTRPAAKMF